MSQKELLEQIIQLQAKVKELTEQNQQIQIKTGIIYAFKHRRFGTHDYVGIHSGKDFQDRKASHLTDLMFQVKVPFYKLIIQQEFESTYEQVVLETIEYTEKRELLDREIFWQQKLRSIQNGNYLQCQKCCQVYKQYKCFVQHREKCFA